MADFLNDAWLPLPDDLDLVALHPTRPIVAYARRPTVGTTFVVESYDADTGVTTHLATYPVLVQALRWVGALLAVHMLAPPRLDFLDPDGNGTVTRIDLPLADFWSFDDPVHNATLHGFGWTKSTCHAARWRVRGEDVAPFGDLLLPTPPPYNPVWNPDGHELVYLAFDTLQRWRTDGGLSETLPSVGEVTANAVHYVSRTQLVVVALQLSSITLQRFDLDVREKPYTLSLSLGPERLFMVARHPESTQMAIALTRNGEVVVADYEALTVARHFGPVAEFARNGLLRYLDPRTLALAQMSTGPGAAPLIDVWGAKGQRQHRVRPRLTEPLRLLGWTGRRVLYATQGRPMQLFLTDAIED